MIKYLIIFFGILHTSFCSCSKATSSGSAEIFDSIPVSRPVVPVVSEASGITDSRINLGYLWTHEDSGNPPDIYLLKHDGTILKKLNVAGAVNRDWEDIVLCRGAIYIGDIGDNDQRHTEYTIYKFAEPAKEKDVVSNIEQIRFTYPDHSHDAEAFLVDSISRDIFIFTKRDNQSKIFKLPFPQSTTSVNKAVIVGELPYNGVVSAALSHNGREMIVKTYTELHYYTRSTGESVEKMLTKNSIKLAYQIEPQGEAICFAANSSGFFTLSEKLLFSSVNLYFYRRK